MDLFEECIEAMGKYVSVCRKEDTEKILTQFDEKFPLIWGRIDWNKIKEKKIISSIEDIIPVLKQENKNPLSLVYIIGSDPTIPVLKSKLDKILEYFDDVEAMSPNTWIYCPTDGWVVEFYHEGEITIGFV